jgi:hypothetical protein
MHYKTDNIIMVLYDYGLELSLHINIYEMHINL